MALTREVDAILHTCNVYHTLRLTELCSNFGFAFFTLEPYV